MEVTLKAAHLRALAHLAGTADPRNWVNGVWIEARGGYVVLMATNGTVMGAIDEGDMEAGPFNLMVPHHILKALPKGRTDEVAIRSDDGLTWFTSSMGVSHRWVVGDEKVIDWRRAVPASTREVHARQFDPTLLGAFVKVRDTLNLPKRAGSVLIAHNGDDALDSRTPGWCAISNAMLVQLPDAPWFVGVMQPLNRAPVRTAAPGWATTAGRAPAPVEDTCDLA